MRDLLRLLRLMKPHRGWVLLGLLLSLLTLLANVGLLALSSWFIASMAIAGATGAILDYSLPSAGVRALALARTGGRYLERLVNHDVTFKLLAALRVWFYERLEPLAPARLQSLHSGDLLSRIQSDVDTLDDFYVRAFVPIIVALLATLLVTLFLFGYSPSLALVELAFLLASGFLLPLLLRRLGEAPGAEAVELASRLRSSIVDEVRGMAELEVFGALDGHSDRLLAVSGELIERQRRLNAIDGAADSGLVGGSALAMWLGAIILVPLFVSGRIAPADLPMLTVLLLASFEAVMPLPSVFGRLGEMAAAARRLYEIIDARPIVADRVEVAELSESRHCREGAGDSLEVQGLRFRYEESGPWIIDGLSLRLKAGGRIALVGPTGAGKSSLVNVLMRFWDYEEGSIRVCGRELRDFPADRGRDFFSVAPQAVFLFNTTIRRNLLLSENPVGGALPPSGAATPIEVGIAAGGAAESRIATALRAAALDEFTAGLPEGIDTMVGESGLRLSAGQARRLSIARALLKPAPFLILDEPTEGLDAATAERLMGSLTESLEGRGLLVISHRKRDLDYVEEIIEMPGRGSNSRSA